MRPERDPSGCIPGTFQRRHAGDQLRGEPEPEHDQCRDGENQWDADEDQYPHRSRRKQQQIGTHHRGDRPAGADHRHGTLRFEGDVSQRSGQPAGQIEEQIADVTHRIFDVVTKHPEKQHIPEKVHDAAVHEHRGKHGGVDAPRLWCQRRERSGEFTRNRSILENEPFQVRHRHGDLIDEHDEIPEDEQPVDYRRQLTAAVVITDRKQRCALSAGSPLQGLQGKNKDVEPGSEIQLYAGHQGVARKYIGQQEFASWNSRQ